MERCAPVGKIRPDRLERLLICEQVLGPVEHHLRASGLEHREEAALIAGYIIGGDIGIGTTVLLPYTESSSVSCALPFEVTLGCVELIQDADQVLLAQMHTHPGRFCTHSGVDDRGAFSDCAGLLSVVVPLFGRYGVRRLLERGIGIHERMPTGDWRKLPEAEGRKRLTIIPSHHVIF